MALADQVPVRSAFGARSTGAEVLADHDLAGRVAIVTGGYSGIGLEAVRALAGRGARVIVPVRDRAKAGPALAGIAGAVETADLDLGRIDSVRRLAADLSASLPRLDLLINNAGIMACPETRVGPGWEAQFGTHHLGHMALTLGRWTCSAGPVVRAWWPCRPPATRSAASAGTTSTSGPRRTTSGRPTDSPRPPTRCSPMR